MNLYFFQIFILNNNFIYNDNSNIYQIDKYLNFWQLTNEKLSLHETFHWLKEKEREVAKSDVTIKRPTRTCPFTLNRVVNPGGPHYSHLSLNIESWSNWIYSTQNSNLNNKSINNI